MWVFVPIRLVSSGRWSRTRTTAVRLAPVSGGPDSAGSSSSSEEQSPGTGLEKVPSVAPPPADAQSSGAASAVAQSAKAKSAGRPPADAHAASTSPATTPSTGTHSAPGSAAGYHFQAQVGLLELLRAQGERAVALESLDDITVSDGATPTTLEQLKHSLTPGSLTDRSSAWWRTLAVWMDLAESRGIEDIDELLLLATDSAPAGSAAALLRAGGRDVQKAERALMAVAIESDGSAATSKSRQRFAAMSRRARARLVAKIEVRDQAPSISDFRAELRDALGLAMPNVGQDLFLDGLVGWWERRVVDLLTGQRETVARGELAEAVAYLRDQYTDSTLPAPLKGVREELSEAVREAYARTPFVHQLVLIVMRNQRIQQLVADYHRAYTQRSKWLQDGALLPDELEAWEDRLADEWDHAFERMLDNLNESTDETECRRAGHELYDSLEASDPGLLRDNRDRFVHVGTLHGLADTRRIGWHPDFAARLQDLLGAADHTAKTDAAFVRSQSYE